MPILIEDILEREHPRDSEWEELVDELNGDPELWEVFAEDRLLDELIRSTENKIIGELTRESVGLKT
ncbi:MAG: hypothetical protein ACPGCN_14545 [bacterium]|jgi:hypothetical protein